MKKKPSSSPSRPLVMRHQQASFGPTYGIEQYLDTYVYSVALCVLIMRTYLNEDFEVVKNYGGIL